MEPRASLTEKQDQVYRIVVDRIQATEIPPTRAEIAQKLGYRSANAAEEHLRAIANKGYLILHPKDRGIQLASRPDLVPRGSIERLIRVWRERIPGLSEIDRSDTETCANELECLIGK